ncbi:MAG: tRNA (guanosine(37)-N1)-methyltransferase TrmD [Gammaproteobacteria bacterium]|nr:tRNA (guanosine(37)-N1)-methyltransferase TrmD [Gammaproteobacteria bacterium]MCP5415705.1 tRNA (guanosine(37)-N1)-methyltransferase TrmD [Chromatiaceae bacterium]
MRFGVVTLFPGMLQSLLETGVTGRAFERRVAQLVLWNPRDYTRDVHRTVDDRPYGGGPGMLMKPEPLLAAIEDARATMPHARVAYLTPQGRRFDQRAATELAQRSAMILIAGRYEGVDERVVGRCVDEEWSIGDYVLSGGELPALVVIDAVVRLLPGALGDDDSAQQDSYMDDLLDCPHYTRPEIFDGEAVPPVLLSGDHQAIRRWRLQQSLGRTWLRRPELLSSRGLSAEEQILLDEFIRAQNAG